MSQNYTYPPGFSTSVNPSVGANGAAAPAFSTEVAGIGPGNLLVPISVDSSGNQNVNVLNSSLPTGGATAANQTLEIADLDALNARTAGALVPVQFDEISLTYIVGGNGDGQIGTATYKLMGVTVKTLTLTYDASNRLTDVTAS